MLNSTDDESDTTDTPPTLDEQLNSDPSQGNALGGDVSEPGNQLIISPDNLPNVITDEDKNLLPDIYRRIPDEYGTYNLLRFSTDEFVGDDDVSYGKSIIIMPVSFAYRTLIRGEGLTDKGRENAEKLVKTEKDLENESFAVSDDNQCITNIPSVLFKIDKKISIKQYVTFLKEDVGFSDVSVNRYVYLTGLLLDCAQAKDLGDRFVYKSLVSLSLSPQSVRNLRKYRGELLANMWFEKQFGKETERPVYKNITKVSIRTVKNRDGNRFKVVDFQPVPVGSVKI